MLTSILNFFISFYLEYYFQTPTYKMYVSCVVSRVIPGNIARPSFITPGVASYDPARFRQNSLLTF